jgi:signal transduction histidine kinase
MDDKKSVAIVLNNLGSVLIQQGKLDAAWVKLDSARTMQEQYGYSRVIATIFANQGEILTLQGKLEEAEPYLQRSVHLADSFHAKVHLAGNLTTLGNLHLRQGKPEAALEDLKRALAAAREVEALPREAEALIGMAKAWMDMKVQDSANHYFLLYSAANDTLRANANFSSITKDLFEREQEMIQERERLEAERQAQIGREQRLLLLSGLALLGMAAIFLFWRLRARRRMALDLERLVEERTAALRLANADLNKFLHQSSHDLRSPLTTILGLADVALTEPGKERHYIQLMRGRAAHLDYAYTSLIQTLTLREREPVSAQVDLAALVRAQLLEAERLRPGRKAQLDLRVQEGTSVTADPYLLGVILRNLLLNGLDFAAEGETAQLELSFGKAEGSWWLRLRDAGEPVQEEVRKRMFEMFYRGSNRSQGTGLGLYNARLAAEKLGGSLEVEATEKGNAFRFEMRLA